MDKKHIISEINTQQEKALKESIKPNHQKNNNNKFRKSLRNKTISLMENPKEINNIMPTEEEIINPYGNKVEDISELTIDFNYPHLIDIKDEDIKESDLNDIPYLQALRLDKRDICKVALTVFLDKVGILNLFCNRRPYSYLSLTINVYLFELFLDLTFNCFLYSDDVVSEKYHNDGNLSMLTSFSLSLISNIISSFVVFIISSLTEYSEFLEIILTYVKYKEKYVYNIFRFVKNVRIKLSIFYALEIILIILMTYYLFIFCAVYHYSQSSIMINYIVGGVTSLAFSAGIT